MALMALSTSSPIADTSGAISRSVASLPQTGVSRPRTLAMNGSTFWINMRAVPCVGEVALNSKKPAEGFRAGWGRKAPFSQADSYSICGDASSHLHLALTEVCKRLGIANAPDAASRLDDDEKMTIGNPDSQTGRGKGKVWGYGLVRFRGRSEGSRRVGHCCP